METGTRAERSLHLANNNLSPIFIKNKLRKSPPSKILVAKKGKATDVAEDKGAEQTAAQPYNTNNNNNNSNNNYNTKQQDQFLDSVGTDSSSTASTPMTASAPGSASSNVMERVYVTEADDTDNRHTISMLHPRNSSKIMLVPPRPASALSLLNPNRGKVDGSVAKQEAKELQKVLRLRILESFKKWFSRKGKKKREKKTKKSEASAFPPVPTVEAQENKIKFVRLILRRRPREPSAKASDEKGKSRKGKEKAVEEDGRRDSKLDLDDLLDYHEENHKGKRRLAIRRAQKKQSAAAATNTTKQPSASSGQHLAPQTPYLSIRASSIKPRSEWQDGTLRLRIRRERDSKEDVEDLEGRMLYHDVIASRVDIHEAHLGSLLGEAASSTASPPTSNTSNVAMKKGKGKERDHGPGFGVPGPSNIAIFTGWHDNHPSSMPQDVINIPSSSSPLLSPPPIIGSKPQEQQAHPFIGIALTTDATVSLPSRDSPFPLAAPTTLPPHGIAHEPNMLPYQIDEEPEVEEAEVVEYKVLVKPGALQSHFSPGSMPIKTLGVSEEREAEGGVKIVDGKQRPATPSSYSVDKSDGGADLELYWTADEGSDEEGGDADHDGDDNDSDGDGDD